MQGFTITQKNAPVPSVFLLGWARRSRVVGKANALDFAFALMRLLLGGSVFMKFTVHTVDHLLIAPVAVVDVGIVVFAFAVMAVVALL